VVRKRINAEILLGAALLLLVAGATGVLMRPALEPDRTIESPFGDVTWNHEQHARMEEIVNCQVCHHHERQGVSEPKACRDCHQVKDKFDNMIQADLFVDLEVPEYKDQFGPPPWQAFHGRCMGCHKAMEKGPVACRDCHEPITSGLHGLVQWDHRTHARKLDMDGLDDGAGNDCVFCHHQDKEALSDGDYRGCRECHQPFAALGLPVETGLRGIDGVQEIEKHKDAKHGECGTCHVENNPEEMDHSCNDCHAPWVFDLSRRELPTLEQAVHKRCLECHNQEEADADYPMPVTCRDCHQSDPSWLTSNENGHVLWNHRRHGMYREMNCDECHHQDLPNEPHMACRKCHDTGLYDNPTLAKAFKKRCIGCHEEKKTGLESWEMLATEKPTVEFHEVETAQGRLRWDHRSHAIADAFACQECHHNILRREDGVYVTSLRAKREWGEEARHIQSCRNCHGDEGPKPGSVAEGSEAPAYEKALQKVCVECHQRLGGGPQSWDALFAPPQIDWDAVIAEQAHAAADHGTEEGAS
jgi:hypothetical protein